MDGAILLGDKETVNILGVQSEKNGGFGAMGELLVEGGVRPRQVELDVLIEETAAERYWLQIVGGAKLQDQNYHLLAKGEVYVVLGIGYSVDQAYKPIFDANIDAAQNTK